MRRSLKSISIITLLLLSQHVAMAQQSIFPSEEGDRAKYTTQIDFNKGYLSGIAILAYMDGCIKGSVFNEFGVSAMTFAYHPNKNKVKIISVTGSLNKWYIKRILKKDLLQLMEVLKKGGTTYENQKYHITYSFNPLDMPDETME